MDSSKKEKFHKDIVKLRKFMLSTRWMLLLCCLAAVFVTFKLEVYGTLIFAVIVGISLVINDDFIASLMPFLLTYMIAIKNYDSFDIFMGYIWIAAPLAVLILSHFIIYRKKYKENITIKGSQFKPMLFVSIAIVMGGYGFISKEEYFALTSIYHMVALGFGMLLLYVLFYANIDVNPKYSMINMLTKIMVIAGLFASFMVISYYLININDIIDRITSNRAVYIQWRNNLSTILMIAMPFAFLQANKKPSYAIVGFVFYFAILLTRSRGGLLFGGIELAMCVIMFVLYDTRRRLAYVFICACLAFAFLIFSRQFFEFFGYTINRLMTALSDFLAGESQETRAIHCARGINDFLNHPIFGTGLGYMGNRDVFASKEFALCWYHCEPIQIAASFGLLGIFAFAYQFIKRNVLLWKKATLFNMTIFLSYISLEFMSLVNPGIMAPIPYLLLITIFMVVVEKCDKGEYQEKLYFRKKKAKTNAE